MAPRDVWLYPALCDRPPGWRLRLWAAINRADADVQPAWAVTAAAHLLTDLTEAREERDAQEEAAACRTARTDRPGGAGPRLGLDTPGGRGPVHPGRGPGGA